MSAPPARDETASMPLVHALRSNADRLGESPALVFSDGSRISWRALWLKVREFAASCASEGLSHGDLVFVAGTPSLEFHVLLWTCARLGLIFAPLNLQFTPDECTRYIAPLLQFYKCCFFSDRIFREKFAMFPQQLQRFALREAEADQTWRCLNSVGLTDDIPWPDSEHGLVLLSTSGSTGFPKPALLPNRSIVSRAIANVGILNWQRTDRYLAMMPMYHIGGLAPAAIAAYAGCALHVMPAFDPAAALHRIEAERITSFGAFDILLDRLMSLPDFTIDKLRSVRQVTFAGSPRFYRIIRSWGISDIATAYAMTETNSVSLTPHACHDERLRRESNGKILPDTEVKIVDPESGHTLSDGVSGEICVRGSGVFLGYLGHEEETRRSFDDDGFFHSGDRGRLQEGYLFFEGRYKAMIKTGGENVSELEVENAIAFEFEEIRRVAVVGISDDKWTEVVCAVIELLPGKTLTLEEMRSRLKSKLAGFKLPRRLISVQPNSWPQLSTGKLDKQTLRTWAAAGQHTV